MEFRRKCKRDKILTDELRLKPLFPQKQTEQSLFLRYVFTLITLSFASFTVVDCSSDRGEWSSWPQWLYRLLRRYLVLSSIFFSVLPGLKIILYPVICEDLSSFVLFAPLLFRDNEKRPKWSISTIWPFASMSGTIWENASSVAITSAGVKVHMAEILSANSRWVIRPDDLTLAWYVGGACGFVGFLWGIAVNWTAIFVPFLLVFPLDQSCTLIMTADGAQFPYVISAQNGILAEEYILHPL